MRLHISRLLEGDVVKANTFSPRGLLLLSPGTVIAKEHITQLFRHQIEYLDVEDERPHMKLPELVAAHPLQSIYETSVIRMKSLFAEAARYGSLMPEEVDGAYEPLVKSIRKETDVVGLLLMLNEKEDYTYEHCVQVGMLSYYIAKWANCSDREAYKARPGCCTISARAKFTARFY